MMRHIALNEMRYVSEDEALLRRVMGERLKLLAYLRSIVRRRDLAEDLFQDLCVLVLQKRDVVAQVRDLGPWLRTSAKNLAMNALRLRANRQILLNDELASLLEADWGAIDAAGSRADDLSQALASCLGKLGSTESGLLRTRYTDGVSVPDIASSLGRPINSLRTTFSRIHKKLAECVLRKVAVAQDR